MKKKVVWMVVSCLMALSLLMASCAPAAVEEEEVVAPLPKVEKEVVTEEEVAPSPEGPIYGGVLRQMRPRDLEGFDSGYAPFPHAVFFTNEELLTGDWSKGPAGTGEISWQTGLFVMECETGCLAESWEMPDEETIVYHIRKGVHFHDKPPTNGREMNAEDVAFSINRLLDMPRSFIRDHHKREDIRSVEATDKWTVVVKCIPEEMPSLFIDISDSMHIVPPEVVEQYGDMRKWEVSCGTGPFMIVDYVPGSFATFVRNPNYWRKDPVHPENTLPYLDGIDVLVLPDRSTRLAALRTGKIDMHERLSWEDQEILLRTSPELLWIEQTAGMPPLVAMRSDTPPFDDIRVRRALALAIDNQAIKDELYGGSAKIFTWPIVDSEDFRDMYTPLDEFPESIRELYEYHPDKARQLLTEAGYPHGFKTSILCTAGSTDMLSVLKNYWADIGVDVELDVKEGGTLRSIMKDKKHKAMSYGNTPAIAPHRFADTRTMNIKNDSVVSDPYIDELYYRVAEKVLEPEHRRILKEEYVPYVLEHWWYIPIPAPNAFTFWQPWLKGYHGEHSVGNVNQNNWPIYVWLDLELRKEMTGR